VAKAVLICLETPPENASDAHCFDQHGERSYFDVDVDACTALADGFDLSWLSGIGIIRCTAKSSSP
jgi:hypothetical protein